MRLRAIKYPLTSGDGRAKAKQYLRFKVSCLVQSIKELIAAIQELLHIFNE